MRLGGDTPYRVANVIGNEQRTLFVLRQSNWRAVQHLLVIRMEAADDHLGLAYWLALLEIDEHDCVAAEWRTVPAAVLADEGLASSSASRRSM